MLQFGRLIIDQNDIKNITERIYHISTKISVLNLSLSYHLPH